ncbi:MAG: 3'-phosphoesterase [Chitinophagales bacterium]|nr:3'-phosphoesterase [Chitinophagales bacterium]
MSLASYKQKRNFNQTSEPEGKIVSSKKKLAFVIQRHKATRLHYDFRLEMDGVLKSWAVPRGPSMNPADKRLAMMVEDHPYDYRTFEGTIPAGNYGAGIVEIWDQGTYTPVDEKHNLITEKAILQNLEKGNIKFSIQGKKLKGEWALVKMKTAENNSWLLIKHKDEYATSEPYDSEKLTPASSLINKELKKVVSAKTKE